MSYNTKNYTEQGGDKTVIGGTLEIKEGAQILGLPSFEIPMATKNTLGGVKAESKTDTDTVPVRIGNAGRLFVAAYPEVPKAANQPNSTADTLETLLADFNSLLEKLKTSGLMEEDTP